MVTRNRGAAIIMTAALAFTQDDVYTALGNLIVAVIGCPVVSGLDNNVPAPAEPYALMSPLSQTRLKTNETSSQSATQTLSTAIQEGVQVDFYGPKAGDWAAIFESVWRDTYACDYFAENYGSVIQPLYNDAVMQMPLVNGEEQYEQRFFVRAFMQYNAAVTLPQQYFTSVDLTVVDVDATIHP